MLTALEKENPLQKAIATQGTLPPSHKKRFYRTLTSGAVVADALYSYFLWQSVCSAAEFAITEFGGVIAPSIKDTIKYIAVPFVVANLLCDLTSVDPLREADQLTAASNKNISEHYELSKKIFGNLLKFIAMTTSYTAGASVDAISIANIIFLVTEGITADVINYSSLAIFTSLGVIYYSMFTNAEIQNHANEFVDIIKNPKAFLRSLKKNLLPMIEVLIQSLSLQRIAEYILDMF